MILRHRRLGLMSLLAFTSLFAAGTAWAVEPEFTFHIGLPPQPFYGTDQRIMISDPDSGSVLTRTPSRITVNFRRFDFDLDPSSLELWVDGAEYTQALRFWTDMAWVDFPVGTAWAPGEHLIVANIRSHAGGSFQSSSLINVILPTCPGGCPWPFSPTAEPNPVSNLMEDWQDFNSLTNPPYFHSGLDIRGVDGAEVHACAAGTVVKKVNYGGISATWEVAVQDAYGYIWQYHHLDLSSITVNVSDPVSQGQVLGTIVDWGPPMNGLPYDHVHLNVARWYGGGSPGLPYTDGYVYYNPLIFLTNGSYSETEYPYEFDTYYCGNSSDTPYAADSDAGTPIVFGSTDVIAKLRDHRNVTGSPTEGQPYELGIYELAYSIVPINTPCGMGFLPRTRLARFDAVPGGKLVSKQLQVLKYIYKETVNYTGVSGTDFTYNNQELFYNLTNVKNGYPDPNGTWETTKDTSLGPLYPDGTYIVKIFAKDFYGNETVTPDTVQVSNSKTYSGICPPFIIDWRWLESIQLQSGTGALYPALPPVAPIDFGPMTEGSSHATLDHTSWPAWIFDLPERGIRIGIGLLAGHQAQVEYIPLLGDVIVDADAEVQVLPPGGAFDPGQPPLHPAPLHLTTRLVRDPATSMALIGAPAAYASTAFKLVMAAPIVVNGEPMTLRSGQGPGPNAEWGVDLTAVEAESRPRQHAAVSVRARPNPFTPGGTLQLTLDRDREISVEVLDVGGRRVRELFHGRLPRGDQSVRWDGRDASGNPVRPGIYVVRARGAGVEGRGRLVLID